MKFKEINLLSNVLIFIFCSAVLSAVLGYSIVLIEQVAVEAEFTEIHGVEDNHCWCPDEC